MPLIITGEKDEKNEQQNRFVEKKIEVEKSTECGRACLLLSILYPRKKKTTAAQKISRLY